MRQFIEYVFSLSIVVAVFAAMFAVVKFLIIFFPISLLTLVVGAWLLRDVD